MFTGIIKEQGRVKSISGLGGLYKLVIEAKDIAGELLIGDSVAVNGVCLTVTENTKNTLSFDVMAETLKRSGLSKLKYGDLVNLEPALKAGSSLGGHFVTGHIDCIGRIKDIRHGSGEVSIEITFAAEFSAYVIEKGSIALDGISLTVGKASGNSVIVYLIPHTLKATTLGLKRAGEEVNIEFDMIGKYVAKLCGRIT